jgi:RNA polymerase sigma-70 factor (ECF subfamily)
VAPKVKGYLIRLGSSAAVSEEVAQDVMLTIWRKAEQFDPAKAGAMTWIFVIARNRRIDRLRREKAEVIYAEVPDVEDENTTSQFDRIAGAERDTRVRAALDCLSPDQWEVVRRSFYEDEAHAAIADALDLPLGTVKSRLRLAMGKLRKRLEELK